MGLFEEAQAQYLAEVGVPLGPNAATVLRLVCEAIEAQRARIQKIEKLLEEKAE